MDTAQAVIVGVILAIVLPLILLVIHRVNNLVKLSRSTSQPVLQMESSVLSLGRRDTGSLVRSNARSASASEADHPIASVLVEMDPVLLGAEPPSPAATSSCCQYPSTTSNGSTLFADRSLSVPTDFSIRPVPAAVSSPPSAEDAD
ncbi:hypothetical protein HDU91_003617 [Kappamyces sp. JEL0680]|nr:hypothetical protein HDU91_003617 [Kappamyces sp. JEL0680]